MKNIFHFSVLTLAFVLSPLMSQAQMFSVDDESTSRTSSPFSSYLRIGIQPIDFVYQGTPEALMGGESLNFSGTAANISYEAGGFNFSVTLGNDITGINDNNYFELGIKFDNPFYLIQTRRFAAGVPIQLSSKIVSVRSDLLSEEFSQTNLSIGAGGVARILFPEKMDLMFNLIPNIGFSTASGGFIGGNAFSLTGKARLNIYNLLFRRNISLGYDYIYDSYDIEGDELDYDLTGHRITLGISL